MKNLAPFRLRDAIVPFVFLISALVYAPQSFGQAESGGKPETMAPTHDMAGDKAKTPSTVLTITFGPKTLTLKPRDLADFPHQNATVVNGHSKTSETYSGVPISAILTKLGMPFDKASEHTLLKTYVIAEGTDGYKTLLSVYETLATIRQSDVIVADAIITDGEFGPLTKDGAYKLVIPGDSRPQRWVQNLKSLTFKTIE